MLALALVLPSALGIMEDGTCFENEKFRGRRIFSYSHTLQVNSPIICMQHCHRAGYSFAAPEFGSHCWCSNEAPTTDDISPEKCTYSCSGYSCLTCGGQYYNNFYTIPENVTMLSDKPCPEHNMTTVSASVSTSTDDVLTTVTDDALKKNFNTTEVMTEKTIGETETQTTTDFEEAITVAASNANPTATTKTPTVGPTRTKTTTSEVSTDSTTPATSDGTTANILATSLQTTVDLTDTVPPTTMNTEVSTMISITKFPTSDAATGTKQAEMSVDSSSPVSMSSSASSLAAGTSVGHETVLYDGNTTCAATTHNTCVFNV
ncbi:Carbohydrate-binding WSC [Trinorchestia longiramus]|nr:Carbohydrate-binding WSC [Trinorchestia longiramus]